jgi:formylglycine-generating enzyme required for sulfatase activity
MKNDCDGDRKRIKKTTPSPGQPSPGKQQKEKKMISNGIEFVFVPGGTFEMGDVFDDGFDLEKPVHTVTVPDFYIAKYPVTQAQYYDVMGENPSHFKKGNEYPVENVSWNDAKEFIKELNEKTGGKIGFRLPSEAEWEYAARSGGKKERYAGGDDIDKLGWYHDNSGGSTHPVGGKQPNGLGVYDMSGNVYEWVEDDYQGDYTGAPTDGSAWVDPPIYNLFRVLRGGSWDFIARCCRSAFRISVLSNRQYNSIGFRLVATNP